MSQIDHSKYRNPPAPPGFDNENSTVVHFYKPELNPIVKMIAAERAAPSSIPNVIDLLDPFLLRTPPVSEDDETSVKEPGEIVNQAKIKEPVPVKFIEFDDSIIHEGLFDYISKEKRKKSCAERQSSAKKKKRRESKCEKDGKIKKLRKHNGIKSKTVSAQKKSRNSSAEESPSSGRSDCSSLNFAESPPLLHSDRSLHRSSKRPESPTQHRKQKSLNSGYGFNRCRSASLSPHVELMHERRSGRKSPTHRSPTYSRHRRHKYSSPKCYPLRSPSPSSLHRRSPSHRSRDSSPSRKISSRRSPRHRSSRRSPSSSPEGKSYRDRSPIGSSTYAKYVNRAQKDFSKRYGSESPDGITVHKARSSRSPEEKQLVVEDEYSKLLAEEMKKRQLIADSDEEPTAFWEIAAFPTLGVPIKQETISDEENTPLSEDQENLVKYELGIVNPNEMQPNASFPQTKFFKQENIKSEYLDPGFLLNSYFCQVCQLGLNSESTWQSHINGKKHAKMKKLQSVYEIAKGSIAIPSTPVLSEDAPRFANAAPGKKRLPISDVARLLPAIMDVKDHPLPCLDFIQEIISEKDINYYCELCDAPCGISSIMPHLIGFKHKLRCLKCINPTCYERNKNQLKRWFEAELNAKLFKHEQKYGRGNIKVMKEEDDPLTRPLYDCPGPNWRHTSSIPDIKKEKEEEGEREITNYNDSLDTSMGDFLCKICDSHMNNVSMWVSHLRGKRHSKNQKHFPGDCLSKAKSVKMPDVPSKLESLIDETAKDELIVGLNFIRETHGINGETYNCFLCGSCSTNCNIIEHLLLAKHRLRYLEKLVTLGIPNSVTIISKMEFHDARFRQSLVDSECQKMVDMYGRGKVEVHQTK